MFLSGVHDEERTILIHILEDYAHYYPGMKNKAAGELHLAIKNFSKAIDIEEPSLEPYSEQIIMSIFFYRTLKETLS